VKDGHGGLQWYRLLNSRDVPTLPGISKGLRFFHVARPFQRGATMAACGVQKIGPIYETRM